MALVIEELTTTLEIHDEVKIRQLVRREIDRALEERERRVTTGRPRTPDPSDPAAGSRMRG